MDLVNYSWDGFIHDTFLLTRNTTINIGLRYEFQSPLVDQNYTNTNLTFASGTPGRSFLADCSMGSTV